ncbi:MAG: hypothetical protein ACM3JQ_05015 [Candidatus Eiseniibacteriota bacterium]
MIFPLFRHNNLRLVFGVTGAQTGDKVIVTSQNDASGVVTQSASVNVTDLVRMSIRNPNPIATHSPKIT